MNLKAICLVLAASAVAAPAKADSGNTSALLTAVLKLQQQRSTSTYEGILAALTQPIRLYDLAGDGLTASDLDVVDQYRATRLRGQRLALFLSRDLNNDRQVSREELDLTARLGLADGSGADLLQLRFDQLDLDHNGILSWDEMSAAPSIGGGRPSDTTAIRAVTIDADPTPNTPFTIEDAHTIVDQLFAIYDTDKNSVLDPSELRAARSG